MVICPLNKLNRLASRGFTLIEVLLALAVISIALTALLKVTAQNIENTHRLKQKNNSHWVAMQAITLLQLHLLAPTPMATQRTTLLGQPIYWRANISPTTIKGMQKLTILVSTKQSGPFLEELTGFRYLG